MIVMTKSSGLQFIVSSGFGSKGVEITYISAVMLQKVSCGCFLGTWARFWCVSLAIGALQLYVYHGVDNGLVRIIKRRWKSLDVEGVRDASTKIMHVADSEIGIINGTLFRSRINKFTILENFYCIDWAKSRKKTMKMPTTWFNSSHVIPTPLKFQPQPFNSPRFRDVMPPHFSTAALRTKWKWPCDICHNCQSSPGKALHSKSEAKIMKIIRLK